MIYEVEVIFERIIEKLGLDAVAKINDELEELHQKISERDSLISILSEQVTATESALRRLISEFESLDDDDEG